MQVYEAGHEIDKDFTIRLEALTKATRYNHAVHVMETGMDNEVIALTSYKEARGFVVKMQFRLATGTKPRWRYAGRAA